MDATSREALQTIWQTSRPKDRADPDHFLHVLFEYETRVRNIEIEARATWIWMVSDAAWLQADFDKRISPRGFPVGFSWDLSDVDEEDEPWALAWQLAIGDVVDHNPPPYPVYTSEEVKAWVEAMNRAQAIMKTKRGRVPGPMALF